MDDSYEIYTSDEEKEVHKRSNISKDLTIEESENESFIHQKPKRNRRVVILTDSEDDEEEEEFERRVLSPRTRMSITGIRPADLSSDSSDLTSDSSEEDEVSQNTSDIDKSHKENSFLRDVSVGNSFRENDKSLTDDETSSSQSEIESPPKDIRQSIAQYSKIFGNASKDKLSSTIMEPEKPHESTINDSNNVSNDETHHNNISSKDEDIINDSGEIGARSKASLQDDQSSTLNQVSKSKVETSAESGKLSNESDVVEIHNTQEIVDISSDEFNESDNKPLNVHKTVQPKINAALTRGSLPSNGVNNPKRVSKEFYDKEVMKLEELRQDLVKAENLLETVGPSLFDGGKQLSIRVASIQNNIKKKASELVNLVVEDDDVIEIKEDNKKPFLDKDVPNWDDLSAAVNAIKPVFTGKQGLNTFNTQKALTMDRLKDIHGSLESRPADDVLADDPKGLKISLMPHQKHALAWMNWRESQKPRGGILADDMGLGKTLSMISLVLDVKNREEENGSDESESEEENDKGWSSKGRRDYYNGGTLIVCPASLMRQWESEVNNRVKRHKLSISVHHGNNRDTKPRHLASYDLVITTYQIVAREMKFNGALFSIAWKRIILDEAHVVRNHKSQCSIAVCELRARCRWALTGTPIHNKEIDIYALLKFLKCSPFDDLGHWKKWIDNKSAGGQQRLNTLMKSLMLRRTKALLQQQGGLECLPERAPCKVIDVILDKEEMNVYQKIMTYSKTLFAQFLFQRAEKNNDLYFMDQGSRPTFMQTKGPNGAYHKMHEKFSKLHGDRDVKSHEILMLLLRLRQICCHCGLIDAMLEDDDDGAPGDTSCSEPEIDLLEQLNKLEINDNATSNLNDTLNDSHSTKVISKASARVLQRSNPVFNLSRPSSKMRKVLQVVEEEILKTSDKAIVVSQWTSTLNILKSHFDEKNVRTSSLNGSIPVQKRQAIVTEFNDPNSSVKILLLSLTAGGVGLNLVGANHLLLIDLHWNPQLESQAQDRIYRVGQKKTVHIYKFMCKDTVEERIKALQDHKLEMANGILTGAKVSAGSKLSIDDLKGLFGL